MEIKLKTFYYGNTNSIETVKINDSVKIFECIPGIAYMNDEIESASYIIYSDTKLKIKSIHSTEVKINGKYLYYIEPAIIEGAEVESIENLNKYIGEIYFKIMKNNLPEHLYKDVETVEQFKAIFNENYLAIGKFVKFTNDGAIVNIIRHKCPGEDFFLPEFNVINYKYKDLFIDIDNEYSPKCIKINKEYKHIYDDNAEQLKTYL